MNSFFRELKQRKVYRVALGYAVVAWLVVQIASTVLSTFHVPEWFLQALTVIVALGFPVALVLAWAFDVTPSGIEKTLEGTGTVTARNRRNVWLLAGVFLIRTRKGRKKAAAHIRNSGLRPEILFGRTPIYCWSLRRLKTSAV
jgi:hypothetical protein